MRVTLGQLRRIIREVVLAGEAKPENMRSMPWPEGSYRPDAQEYLGMSLSPYPMGNYRPEDALAYIGMKFLTVAGEDVESENGEEAGNGETSSPAGEESDVSMRSAEPEDEDDADEEVEEDDLEQEEEPEREEQ